MLTVGGIPFFLIFFTTKSATFCALSLFVKPSFPGNPGIVALLFFYFLVYFFCYFFFMTASFGVIIDVSRMQAEMNNKNRTIRKIGVVLL